jgi:hypothetical protein
MHGKSACLIVDLRPRLYIEHLLLTNVLTGGYTFSIYSTRRTCTYCCRPVELGTYVLDKC